MVYTIRLLYTGMDCRPPMNARYATRDLKASNAKEVWWEILSSVQLQQLLQSGDIDLFESMAKMRNGLARKGLDTLFMFTDSRVFRNKSTTPRTR